MRCRFSIPTLAASAASGIVAGREASVSFVPKSEQPRRLFYDSSAADVDGRGPPRGWDELDVVFVTGDAYIDHPSFAMAILGRVLEAAGFRVGIVSQPDWRKVDDWRRFGRPRLFFAISAGNMDSMINHYTANKKVRNDDAYSPGGRIGLRPDRATLSYCQRAREAYPGVPVIAGGVEASLRRLAHYDYWSDKVRRSILLDCKADLLVFGMGEETIVEIAQRLRARRDGERPARHARRGLRPRGAVENAAGQIRLTCCPTLSKQVVRATSRPSPKRRGSSTTRPTRTTPSGWCSGTTGRRSSPIRRRFRSRRPRWTRSTTCPTRAGRTRSYTEPIPAFEMIKDSVTIMRGCFGGCTFCSITAHQGRIIQSRSKESVLARNRADGGRPEVQRRRSATSAARRPTCIEMNCTRPEVEAICRRQSCVHPTICKLLGTDHGPLVELMKEARETPGIRKVLVASGIRMDLARRSPEYMHELAQHHVGGHLKVAPEHTDPDVLMKMHKPANDDFEQFAEVFDRESKKAGKKQYIVPYFIASHPASDLDAMIDLAVFLKRNGYRPDQVQDFIPAPFDVATAMYYTGIDPFTKKPVYIARQLRDRKLQRALMQFFKPENYFEVREALQQAKRTDLIGDGCDSLIPSRPPKEALQRRRQDANQRFAGNYVHTPPGTRVAGNPKAIAPKARPRLSAAKMR